MKRLILLALLPACLEAATTTCDDRLCAPGQVCSPAGICVLAEALDACAGLEDGTACAYPGTTGFCVDDTCVGVNCGDGIAIAPEECDGVDLAGETCLDHGFYDEAGLACRDNCTVDTTACTGYCGDGAKNGDELCDGDELGAATCLDFDFTEQPGLACNAGCGFDTSACLGFCGDGIKNGDEDCDGADLGTADCTTLDYYVAAGLACTGFCAFEDASCTGFCGDGFVEPGEELCDGAWLSAQGCQDFGFDAGHIDCSGQCVPDFGPCGAIGWRDESLNASPIFRDVWGSGPNDLWAINTVIGLYHYAGSWAQATSPTFEQLWTGWSAAEDDAWLLAGNSAPKVFRWNGTTWTAAALPEFTPMLFDVWGSSATDVWAVGQAGVILHFDGTAWTTAVSPGGGSLYSVHGISATDVWAVGQSGVTRHYDGTTWSYVTAATVEDLFDVSATATDDAWAIGPSDEVFRWNGTTWSSMPLVDSDARAIWSSGPRDVWLVQGSGTSGGWSYHWDGVHWAKIATGSARAMTGVWGSGAGDVWAVGYSGAIIHNTGSAWTETTLPASDTTRIYAAWAAASDDAWLVGEFGRLYHYDGAEVVLSSTPSSGTLRAVWGAAADDVWVGGTSLLLRGDGTSWQTVSSTISVNQISGSAADNVWIVSDAAAYRWDGDSLDSAGPGGLAIWAAAPNDVWIVGVTGATHHYDGTAWTQYASHTGLPFSGVWSSAFDDVWAVAPGGLVTHFDGTDWTAVPNVTTAQLRAVSGTAADDVWATGSEGTLLHYDGVKWTPVTSRAGSTIDIFAVATTPRTTMFAGSNVFFDRLDRAEPWACRVTETACDDATDDDCDGRMDALDDDC